MGGLWNGSNFWRSVKSSSNRISRINRRKYTKMHKLCVRFQQSGMPNQMSLFLGSLNFSVKGKSSVKKLRQFNLTVYSLREYYLYIIIKEM
jgi:hypothetical protein